jgi:hypothetical protein
MRALETEVESLRQEMRARDEALRDELAVIRRNIDGVRDALAALGADSSPAPSPSAKPAAPDAPATPDAAEAERDALDNELDVKAKTFVKESMDRLLEITKKLLDRMDQELEKRDEPPADGGRTPDAGQGESI